MSLDGVRENEMGTIGEKVRSARTSASMTQEQLAAKAGVTVSTISKLERGQENLTLETLRAIASALEMEPRSLLPASPQVLMDELRDRVLEMRGELEALRDWIGDHSDDAGSAAKFLDDIIAKYLGRSS